MAKKIEIPIGWQEIKIGNVAEIISSNVDKHIVDTEIKAKLCRLMIPIPGSH